LILTDDEKARISAEEEFRAELRRQFAEPKQSRWWTFLNSAFGLWLLGSVSLAVITFLYQKLDSSYKANTERAEIRRKVKQELEMRFSVAGYYLLLDKTQSCTKESEQPPSPELTGLILRAVNGEDGVTYEEFRRISALALFSQLFQLDEPSAYVNLPEQEKLLFIAKQNWMYLEPKLRIRIAQPQMDVKLRCGELHQRFGKIRTSFTKNPGTANFSNDDIPPASAVVRE
jgi:hypothetical protein